MKVTQEKLPASQIGLEIEIAPEITQKAYEQVIKNLANTVNIPGFRRGKVPRQVLLQRLGITRVKAAALEEILQEGIEQALKQEDIPAIGQPQLSSSFDDLIKNYEPGKPLIFTAAVDVEPEVKLLQYTGLTVKAEEIAYEPERVEEVLEKERQELGTLIPVEGRPAQIGDVAIVDFQGVLAPKEGDETAEPKTIPGAEGSDFKVELEEDKFIPGFVSGMVGMNPGETKEIPAQFPDPYANPDLAGKQAIFTVTLKEIKEKELPELNDDFAQEVSDFETLEELRGSLIERYQKEAEDKTKSNKEEALLAELVTYIEVDLPETMIYKEVDMMLNQRFMQLSQQGVDVRKLFTQEIVGSLRERSRDEAVERLKRALALQEVSKRESITVTPAEIQARVIELLQQYPDEDVDEDKLESIVENGLLTEKILDWLLANSTVELVPAGSLTNEDEESEIITLETEAQIIETATESTTEA